MVDPKQPVKRSTDGVEGLALIRVMASEVTYAAQYGTPKQRSIIGGILNTCYNNCMEIFKSTEQLVIDEYRQRMKDKVVANG